jgi:outer membrane lipoprotein-sorting protein
MGTKMKILSGLLLAAVLLMIYVFIPIPAASEEINKALADVESRDIADVGSHLKRLEKNMADFKSMKTDFIQEKNLAVFKNKIVLKGRIYVQRPDRVAWHVDRPVKYSVLITDRFIRQWDEDTDKVQEISLSGNPVFRIALKQMTAWFSGSFSSLTEEYNIRIVQQRPFIIEFMPKEKNFARKVIKSVTITFREDERYLSKITIRELSGDVTTISFENTILNIPLDERFFRIEHRV